MDNISEPVDNETWDGCVGYDRTVLEVIDFIFDDTQLTSVFWIITFTTIVLFFSFIENCHFVMNNIPNHDRVIRIMCMLGIFPIFAVMSLLALLFPRASVICNLTATCFYAVSVYFFMGLVVFYFGGYEQAVTKIADTEVPILCGKKPTVLLTEWGFFRLRIFVIQFAIFRTLLMFIESVLFVNESYSLSQMTSANGSLVIYSLVMVSGGMFMCALYVIHNASKPTLKGFYLSAKFLLLFMGFVLSDVQMIVIGVLTTKNVIPCVFPFDGLNRANSWYSFLQIIECAAIYPIVMWYFRTRKGNIVSKVDMVKKIRKAFRGKWKKRQLDKGPSKKSLYNSYTNM